MAAKHLARGSRHSHVQMRMPPPRIARGTRPHRARQAQDFRVPADAQRLVRPSEADARIHQTADA